MMYDVCGEFCHEPSWKISDSGLASIIFDEDDDFFVYLGFINWLTVVFTGIALEMFMSLFYFKNGWTRVHGIQCS